MDQDQQRDPADEAANAAEMRDTWEPGDGPTGSADDDLSALDGRQAVLDQLVRDGVRVPDDLYQRGTHGPWPGAPLTAEPPALPGHDTLLRLAYASLAGTSGGLPRTDVARAYIELARELRESVTVAGVPDHVHSLDVTGGPLGVLVPDETDQNVLGRTREVPLVNIPWRADDLAPRVDDLRNAQRSRAPQKCARCHTLVRWDSTHEVFRHIDPEGATRALGLHDVVTTT